MNEEKINYWLEVFRSNKYAFMSKDGLVIPIYKAFEQLKEYKSVLDEIRKKVERLDYDKFVYTKTALKDNKKDLLQILDKVKE